MNYIEKSTFDFLRALEINNSREWFAENRTQYELALENVKQFIQSLIQELSRMDPQIHEGISASKCLFRIYRDTRFSKDKTPYKTWFAAGISVDGRKLDGPEYYIRISPEECYLACGYWRPGKPHLEAIRQEIDYNLPNIQEILDKALKMGKISLDQEDKLVRPPAGYDKDNTAVEFLKLKSFVLTEKVSEQFFLTKDALSHVISSYSTMLPFKQFLHEAIDID